MNTDGPQSANRWWIYQRERFPMAAHGILIAAFSLSTVGYTTFLLGLPAPPALATMVAFVLLFLFFMQMRIADEFKDFDDDLRYRPERPVPRGLVSLRELGLLAGLLAFAQLVLALWMQPALVVLLGITWVYFTLMTLEFFVPTWLTAHPGAYLVSHLVILPLLALVASACIWLPVGNSPPRLGWLLALSYASGAVLEIGRKVAAPQDERPGVRSYTALWGRQRAVGAWLAAQLLTGLCATLAARQVDFLLPMLVMIGVLLLGAARIGWRFLAAPDAAGAKHLATFSTLWVFVVYPCLGIVPLCWRYWAAILGSAT